MYRVNKKVKKRNLAIVMAKRFDTALIIHKGIVTAFVGNGPDRTRIVADWNDDEAIHKMVLELNHGKFRNEKNLKGVA